MAEALKELAVASCVVDGEVAIADADGIPSLDLLDRPLRKSPKRSCAPLTSLNLMVRTCGDCPLSNARPVWKAQLKKVWT